MKKRKFYTIVGAIVALALILACGLPAAQTQYIVVTATSQPQSISQAQPTPLPTDTPVPIPPTPIPTPTLDPPMVTATRPVDCLPYPHFGFLYDDGIEKGVSVPVVAKAEAKWSEPGVNWYEVKFNDAGEDFDCWVYSSFVTKSGDFSQLKVNPVVIPWPPPPPYCDIATKVAKVYVGMWVHLPNGQDAVRGRTGWFDGMAQYGGKKTRVTEISGIDISGCMTVHVEIDGSQYPWRVRNLSLGAN